MREPTNDPSTDAGPESGAGDADTVRSTRRRWLVAGFVLVVTVVLLAVAFTPRTVAEGGEGDRSWRVTVTPGIVTSSIRLRAADGYEHRASGFGFRPPLDATQVWFVPRAPDGAPTTLVVGLTPPGTDSVRVTSDVRGVGEANLQRVAWRRVHLAVIDAEAWIEQLVAIGEDGRVLDAVSDLGSPVGSRSEHAGAVGRIDRPGRAGAVSRFGPRSRR